MITFALSKLNKNGPEKIKVKMTTEDFTLYFLRKLEVQNTNGTRKKDKKENKIAWPYKEPLSKKPFSLSVMDDTQKSSGIIL